MSADEHASYAIHERLWKGHMTQRSLAHRMGVTESSLGRKMRGSRKWTLDDLVQVAGILEVSVADLLPPQKGSGDGRTSNGVTRQYSDAGRSRLRLAPAA